MNYQYPDRIAVEENGEIEVVPLFSIMEILVEGESTGFENEAFKKSKEIEKLVNELATAGYSSENLSLLNVSIETSTGRLMKTTQAKFKLKLDKIPLVSIPNILGIIASQKNIEILEMIYEFGDLRSEKEKLLLETCRVTKQQGIQICSAFGVELQGIYSMTQKWIYPVHEAISQRHSNSVARMSKSIEVNKRELEGLEFIPNYKSKLILSLKAEFRVGEFQAI